MSFEIIGSDHPALDMPPQLEALMVLGVAPGIVAGVAATAGTFAAWLAKDGWSAGEYNNFMRMMNDTFSQWDKLGWVKGADGKSCWRKYPAKRAEWKAFWTRFGKHYRAHGQVSTLSFLSDSEEGPARAFMAGLQQWGTGFFEKVCGADIGVTTGLDPDSGAPPPDVGGPGDFLKYGAWLVGGLVVLNVISGLRGAFPRKPPQ